MGYKDGQNLMSDENLSVKQICERLGIAQSTLCKDVGPGVQNL
jgi:16S rRNA A1518/A1519 N6-dimethyltransferase RsmA/KsgA/DIM1 with predicted DNA glycosylase/AP lyase activity